MAPPVAGPRALRDLAGQRGDGGGRAGRAGGVSPVHYSASRRIDRHGRASRSDPWSIAAAACRAASARSACRGGSAAPSRDQPCTSTTSLGERLPFPLVRSTNGWAARRVTGEARPAPLVELARRRPDVRHRSPSEPTSSSGPGRHRSRQQQPTIFSPWRSGSPDDAASYAGAILSIARSPARWAVESLGDDAVKRPAAGPPSQRDASARRRGRGRPDAGGASARRVNSSQRRARRSTVVRRRRRRGVRNTSNTIRSAGVSAESWRCGLPPDAGASAAHRMTAPCRPG